MELLVWRKLASAKWADAWEERLRFLGSERLAFTLLAGGRSVRIEAYGVSAKEADRLVHQFGGTASPLAPGPWVCPDRNSTPPLRIRRRLLICREPTPRPTVATASRAHTRELIIPAGMAFGTGEHATTAGCLRFLVDLSSQLPEGGWSLLDLGCGSGILALAARIFGAATAHGIDLDPHAIRTARENARLNGLRLVRFTRADLREGFPPGRYDVIAANLFSELLVPLLPRIARALKPGGYAVLSGILRSQEPEVVAALRRTRLCLLHTTRRGKWVVLVAR